MNHVALPLPSTVAWRRLAPALVMIAAVLLVFHGTAADMVEIWIRSSTFAHAFLVPPIVAWLIWRQRDELAALPTRPQPWLLLAIAAMCVLWLMGRLVGVNTAPQLALVAMIVATVPAIFGWPVTRALTFPLLFLFFAVPVGEFMVPSMMEWTANFTVAALQWTGIPVYREGQQFVIPSGSWSVVEACSGIRYLIASFMVGTLFAYLNFSSTRRRLAFILISLVVPIVANWLRAYMIVMLGHLSGNRIAVGVDHIIYGWVFFGLVVGAMFMIGARWADTGEVAAPVSERTEDAGQGAAGASRLWVVCAGILALAVIAQAEFQRLDRDHQIQAPAVDLPAGFGNGWQRLDAQVSDWEPAFAAPRRIASAGYRAGASDVGLWVGFYRDQGHDHKLVSSVNDMTPHEHSPKWMQTGTGWRSVTLAGASLEVRTGDLRGSLVPDIGADRLRVWQVYWVGGRWMTSETRVRLQLALDRLLGQGDDSAVVFLYTHLSQDTSAAEASADEVLARFADNSLSTLNDRLAQASRAP